MSDDCAVFWVETDRACDVEILGTREHTFEVQGHHYGLVRARGLASGTWHEYDVALDGQRVWPPPESPFPPSRFRTYPKDAALQVVFGSCRIAAPHEPPYSLGKDQDSRGRETDALRALALRMRDQDPEEWPDLLLMLGDQVYVDESAPATHEFIRSRRGAHPLVGQDVFDFEEYTRLYHETWGEPAMRWLLSTVPSAMVFDDHDVHDDWNTSAAWVEKMRRGPLWEEHVASALMSYWVYQHLGNLSPEALEQDELFGRVREAADAGALLHEFALRADRQTDGSRWSYSRDLGESRLVVIDSRAGRVLEEGRRSMLDADEWRWVEEHATGGFDHLLLATSLPWLLAPAMHDLEAWNEAVCGGAWGRVAARAGERLRERLDLEHWAAFNESFERLAEIQRAVAAGERGEAPASILTLSGDVHHAYLSEVAFPRSSRIASPVYQAVCSPFRNPLDAHERRAIHAMLSPLAAPLFRALARSAGVRDPSVRWRMVGDSPWFDNQFATLALDGRRADLRIDKAVPDGADGVRIEEVLVQRIA